MSSAQPGRNTAFYSSSIVLLWERQQELQRHKQSHQIVSQRLVDVRRLRQQLTENGANVGMGI